MRTLFRASNKRRVRGVRSSFELNMEQFQLAEIELAICYRWPTPSAIRIARRKEGTPRQSSTTLLSGRCSHTERAARCVSPAHSAGVPESTALRLGRGEPPVLQPVDVGAPAPGRGLDQGAVPRPMKVGAVGNDRARATLHVLAPATRGVRRHISASTACTRNPSCNRLGGC